MAVNARDTQIIREAIIAPIPNARDYQIVREAIILVNLSAQDYQIFREAIIPATSVGGRKLPVLFAVT